MIRLARHSPRTGAPHHPVDNGRHDRPHCEHELQHEWHYDLAAVMLDPAHDVPIDLFGREGRNKLVTASLCGLCSK
jgi:hypothetical protein